MLGNKKEVDRGEKYVERWGRRESGGEVNGCAVLGQTLTG